MAPIDFEIANKDSKKVAKLLDVIGISYTSQKSDYQIADLNRSNWIVIPEEFTNGKYRALVNPARLSYCSAVEKVAEDLDLDLDLEDNSTDSIGRNFIGFINWGESLKINLTLGNKTPNFSEATDFLKLLYQGMRGKKVYNKLGKQLDGKFLENIFDDIVRAQYPERSEWLEDKFTLKNNEHKINNNYTLNKRRHLVPDYSEVLDSNTSVEILSGKNEKISLESWINNPTKQGLPDKKTKWGNFNYRAPAKNNNSVTIFDTYSGWACFDCWRNPFYRDRHLGMRSLKRE